MTQSLINLEQTKLWTQPWLSSASWDCLWIISPAFFSSFIALAFRQQLENTNGVPLWAWICLILFVDVAHVYATLFRTYFDKTAYQRNKSLLLLIPIACWIIGCLLYSTDALIFWRGLAYLAVFHFIRQQYGFVVLYSRKDPPIFEKFGWLDQLVVYIATIYPLLFWHTHLPRNFNWFVDGDFINSVPLLVAQVASVIYAVITIMYFFKEIILFKATGFFNFSKNLLLLGTALSWWVGIITLNSDMAFTMTNVLSHGIPYMALIWLYQHKQSNIKSLSDKASKKILPISIKDYIMSYVPAFFISLVLLAYLEEGLWDGFVWREHLGLFAPFTHLPIISDPAILAILIPLLSLPQSTHYVLDGFIWRVKDRSNIWST